MNRRDFIRQALFGIAAPVAAVLPVVTPTLAETDRKALEKYSGATIGALVIGTGATLSGLNITGTDVGMQIESQSGDRIMLDMPVRAEHKLRTP